MSNQHLKIVIACRASLGSNLHLLMMGSCFVADICQQFVCQLVFDLLINVSQLDSEPLKLA